MEEKKVSLEELEDMLVLDKDNSSSFSFANIWSVIVLNWHWFVLSLFICIFSSWLYLRYTMPTYRVTARILIKSDNSQSSSASQVKSSNQEFGFLSNSTGIENEVQVLCSRVLLREVVSDLKLYIEYRAVGNIVKPLVYHSQPVNVDLDPVHLDSLDKLLLTGTRSIMMELSSNNDLYQVEGRLLKNDQVEKRFIRKFKSLPASFRTDYGVLTFRSQDGVRKMHNNERYEVTILPPMLVATRYLSNLSVAPMSSQTSVAQLTLRDENVERGLDFLRQVALCYNRQANADKNEIALRTEEFINDRMAKINSELGSTEGALEDYKRRNAVTNLSVDASQSVHMSNEYASRLSSANSQIQMLDYLREFVMNPDNKNQIIPSNVGLTDGASTALIANYNKAVQDRNRLLKSASEQAPQVLTITATIDELKSSIQTALLQARKSADIARQGIQSEYAKYQGRISSTPVQERILNQIGRQQDVKSGLYLMLLQKREENSIALAATADKGKLLDEPLFEGKVSPKSSLIILLSIVFGLLLPALILVLRNFFRYKIGGRDDVERLTSLDIVADVPVASESVKGTAGIVVKADRNHQIDEIFRSMRTNIQFMLKEEQKIILFTSSMPGEGKTFNAANLAVSFALLGKKVILCGLDIRKPALGRLFNISDKSEGITNLLSQGSVTAADVQQVIVPSGINDHLDLLLAGPVPPNPTELLARQSFDQVMVFLREQYDYIILDTAPVGIVSDTLQISRVADLTVYICRADYTPKSNFALLNGLAEEQKLPNPCVVINGIDMSKRKYGYYYGYGRYGKYGRYGYGKYGYGRYGQGKYGYGHYGTYGQYGRYANSHYGHKDDNSIKK
jgi:capsular exopolysaccharide synthesis family protein